MNIQSMLVKIDKQIAGLTNKRGQLAKAALLMAELTPPKTAAAPKPKGHPSGKAAKPTKAIAGKSPGKGKITPAGRKRIADAQRKRWARIAREKLTATPKPSKVAQIKAAKPRPPVPAKSKKKSSAADLVAYHARQAPATDGQRELDEMLENLDKPQADEQAGVNDGEQVNDQE